MERVRNSRPRPTASDLVQGVGYYFNIVDEVDDGGEIYQLLYREPFLRYGADPKRSAHNPLNLIRKPALIFRDCDGQEKLRIIRASRIPPKFDLFAPSEPSRANYLDLPPKGETLPRPHSACASHHLERVGTITLTSVFRNKYRIQLNAGPLWRALDMVFHMPLFTIYFHGHAGDELHVWVAVHHSKRQWVVLREPKLNHPYLLPALAFIHREWWCFS